MKTIVVSVAALALVGCTATTPKKQAAPFVPTAFVVESDKGYIEKSLNDVRSKLKDPDSARFYGVHMTKRDLGQENPNVCGYVNSKNSYGGYVGKTRFLSGNGFVALWEDRPGPYGSVDNLVIRNNCTLKSGEKAPSNSIEWK
ncbi:hypothetical protein [Alcaligenes faecalis]|uniref:hypothetical protein n=1 Tax=Alcaligenes faecalis TaxID=511 RepID=UPI0018EED8ED|nr:hypothetical protein [Alcaligenes faecalis]